MLEGLRTHHSENSFPGMVAVLMTDDVWALGDLMFFGIVLGLALSLWG